MKALKWVALILLVVGGAWYFGPFRSDNSKTNSDNVEVNAVDQVYLVIDNESIDLSANSGTSVLDLMNTAQVESKLNFSGQEFEGLGFLVQEINGVKNSSDENTYWTLYVNGEMAQVGVSEQKISSGDIIEWKYEKIEF